MTQPIDSDIDIFISENGLKTLTEEKIFYTSKFAKIQWSCDINQELPIKMAKSNEPGSETPITVSQAFINQHSRLKDQLCLQYIEDPPTQQEENVSPFRRDNQIKIHEYTWDLYYQMSFAFAKALHVLGIPERSCVLIQGVNRPEHMISMMGTTLSNCIYTDIYMTNNPKVCYSQVEQTKARIIVCDTYKRLRNSFLDQHEEQLAKLGVVACFLFGEGTTSECSSVVYSSKHLKIYNWGQIMKFGQEVEDRVVHKKIKNQRPGMCCSVVFTSGTMRDQPRGVMLSHDNMTWFWSAYNNQKYDSPASSGLQLIQDINQSKAQPEELPPSRMVSFLPLSLVRVNWI